MGCKRHERRVYVSSLRHRNSTSLKLTSFSRSSRTFKTSTLHRDSFVRRCFAAIFSPTLSPTSTFNEVADHFDQSHLSLIFLPLKYILFGSIPVLLREVEIEHCVSYRKDNGFFAASNCLIPTQIHGGYVWCRVKFKATIEKANLCVTSGEYASAWTVYNFHFFPDSLFGFCPYPYEKVKILYQRILRFCLPKNHFSNIRLTLRIP